MSAIPARAVSDMYWLAPSVVAHGRRQSRTGIRPVANAGVHPDWLEAAGCAQRTPRVHESESGVEIEPFGIIDALRPDVAPEVA